MLVRSFTLLLLLVVLSFGQGLNTQANKDDWEQINFEFNSSVLVDGFPSLLRLAELVANNPGYKVQVDGNTDAIGSNSYNDKLGLARANTVKAFLEKYGARPGQIEVVSHGEQAPRADNATPEGRFMNRRVVLIILDAQGRRIAAGGVGEAIRAMPGGAPQAVQPTQARDCCDDILRRLDKLDDILAALKDLKSENERLKADVEALKQAQTRPVEGPKPLTGPEIGEIARTATTEAIERSRMPRFSLLGMNAGVDDSRHLTFTGKGRFFAPFKERFAFQSEAEYLYFRDRQEGQFDFGLVHRDRRFQAGLFSSFKHVNFRDYQNGAVLGQGSVTLDYIFSRGRLGVFGSKAFLDNTVVNRFRVGANVFDETYVKVVDQVGASTTLALAGRTYLEANLGYLKSRGGADRPGGTIRFVQPLSDRWAFTLEGGFNETLLGRDNNGRVVAGVQFGSVLRPKDYLTVDHPVPADIPRIRYELLTRRVRTGNSAPIADAGSDQIGVPAGQVQLDGSASSDPDNDPLTFLWEQIAGQPVSLSSPTSAVATFTAGESQNYAFRLTVKDPTGAQSIDRVNVTTRAPDQVRIVRFEANPSFIRAGQTTTLVWQVENAETVEITSLGRVDPRAGTSTVTLRETTTYRITARNRTSEANQALTVTVDRPQVRIISFTATPMTINAGQASTLAWQTENADRVQISEVGSVAVNGAAPVSPTQTTTYTITASNEFSSVSSTVVVQVAGSNQAPRIIRFTALPMSILPGERTTLIWLVENATEVTISPTVGPVALEGSAEVSPTQTTSYTITARNSVGQATANTTVTLRQAATIAKCMAMPMVSPRAGAPIALSFEAQNANQVVLAGVGPVTSPVVVNPTMNMTYTLTAIGERSQATCQIMVTIMGMGGPD